MNMRAFITVIANQGTVVTYFSRLAASVGASDILRYLPLQDLTGTVALDQSGNVGNGTYSGSPTLGETGVPTTRKSVKFVSSSYCDLYSAALAAAHTPDEMSAGCFFKPPASTWWTNNTTCDFFQFRYNASNLRSLVKNSSNLITFNNSSGGVSKPVQFGSAAYVPTFWLHLMVTVSKSNNRARLYINGVQMGTSVDLGTYTTSGTLDVNYAVVGSESKSAVNSSLGWQSDFILVKKELTPEQVVLAANPFVSDAVPYFAIGDSKTSSDLLSWRTYLTGSMQSREKLYYTSPAVFAASGWTTQVVKDGIDAALAARTAVPTYIIVNLGANDVTGGDPGVTWKNNTAYIANACHTKYPNAIIYLTKIWRRASGGSVAGTAAINGYIDQLVADPSYSGWLRVGVNEADFLPSTDDGATYTSDGLHPNAAGYALWGEAMAGILSI